MKTLSTSSAVIDALGGTTKTARLVGRTPQNVYMWRSRGFPPETYLVFHHILAERGFRAPVSLWRMVEPSQTRAAS